MGKKFTSLLISKKKKNVADTACPFVLQPGQGSGDTGTGECVSGWSGRGKTKPGG